MGIISIVILAVITAVFCVAGLVYSKRQDKRYEELQQEIIEFVDAVR